MKIFYVLSITFIFTLLILRLTTVVPDNSYPQVVTFNHTERATVRIVVQKKDGRYSAGSGTVFNVDDKSIYILTAGHVISGYQTHTEYADNVVVNFFSDGRKASVSFYVVVLWYKYDDDGDVAVLKIDKEVLKMTRTIYYMIIHCVGIIFSI